MLALLYQFPTWLQHLYGGVVWRKRVPDHKVAYLTFDDGPIPEVTPKVLEILQRYNVKATFFMVGENVSKHPEVFQAVQSQGHAIGNHTYNHIKGCKYWTKNYLANIAQADALLHTHLFRPPYGRMRCTEKWALHHKGYTIVLWDVLTHDYNKRYSAKRMVAIVRRYVRDGSVINFHDSLRSGDRMLQALPFVIEHLLKEGYELRTL